MEITSAWSKMKDYAPIAPILVCRVLEYFEAVSELTLLPPIARGDTAVYTCEVEGHFVQNYTMTSDSIFVNISGNSSFVLRCDNITANEP